MLCYLWRAIYLLLLFLVLLIFLLLVQLVLHGGFCCGGCLLDLDFLNVRTPGLRAPALSHDAPQHAL